MKFLFYFLTLSWVLWSKSSAEEAFEAFNQVYAASTTLSANGSACHDQLRVYPLPNGSDCATCQPGLNVQCRHGLFCFRFSYNAKEIDEKCRIDEYTSTRTGCNTCYDGVVFDSSCPCCYKDAFTCFSHTFPGVSDVDKMRICVLNKTECDVHYIQADHLVSLCGEGDIAAVNDTIAQYSFDAVLKAENNERWLCLHRAAALGRKDFVETLLNSGASVDQRSSTEWTALHHAAFTDRADVVQLLLERGADIEARGEGGETPLRIAIGGNSTETIVILIRKGATMKNATDPDSLNGFNEGMKNDDVKNAIEEGTLGFCEKNALCKNGGTCAYENEALFCICRHSMGGRYCEECKDVCLSDELLKLQEEIKGIGGEIKSGINETVVDAKDELQNDIKHLQDDLTGLKTKVNKIMENQEDDVTGLKTKVNKIMKNQEELLRIMKAPWLLIQRHNFKVSWPFKNKGWASYKYGFGTPSESSPEYWLGNDELHRLTSTDVWTLKIQVTWWKNKGGSGSGIYDPREGTVGTAEWPNFKVGSEAQNYKLGIGRISRSDNLKGDLFYSSGDRNINGAAFSTSDRDNDNDSNINCVFWSGGNLGGWWFNNCASIFLNSQSDWALDGGYGQPWAHPSQSTMWIKRY